MGSKFTSASLRRALDQGAPTARTNKLFGQAVPGKKPMPDKHALLERVFFDDLARQQLPLPEKEYYFHPARRWRFDYCWPAAGLALEVEGGVSKFFKSRHTTADGYKEDCEKYNAATVRGWRVLRCDWAQLGVGVMLVHVATLLARPVLIVELEA